jgi:hypothetical protein
MIRFIGNTVSSQRSDFFDGIVAISATFCNFLNDMKILLIISFTGVLIIVGTLAYTLSLMVVVTLEIAWSSPSRMTGSQEC